MQRLLLGLFCLLLTSTGLFSQSKITIEDRQQLLTSEVREALKTKFSGFSLDYSNLVDFTMKCDYYFASIEQVESELLFNIKDCDDQILGQKTLSSSLLAASIDEQVIVYFYNLKSIIETPQSTNEYVSSSNSESTVPRGPLETQHDSRYFFSPTAYNLKEGEFYYNTLYFLVHDVQVGLHDQFSIGVGTTIGGFPFYANAKANFKLGEKTNLAIGDLAIIGTYDTDFFANLAFTTVTRGSKETNISFGLGLLSTPDNSISNKTNSLVYNLGGMVKAQDYLYFVSENYLFGYNTVEFAYFQGDGFVDTFQERFTVRDQLLFGISGVRLVRKRNELASWQFGFMYFLQFQADYPSRYKEAGWEVYRSPGANLIAFPMFSYTLKFQL